MSWYIALTAAGTCSCLSTRIAGGGGCAQGGRRREGEDDVQGRPQPPRSYRAGAVCVVGVREREREVNRAGLVR